MLADAFHTILPDFQNEEMLEIFGIYHLAKENRGFSNRPPYRHPHHSASAVSLIGGGTFPKPGEISLSHGGVLFLDELGEFPRKALDMLRQPMESGEVTISRVRQSVTYPASFTLIAATNPCPCGYFGSNERYCTCTPQQIKAYQLKASGPLLDRMDFILNLKSLGLAEAHLTDTSATIRARTKKARNLQKERYGGLGLNGNIPFGFFNKVSSLGDSQRDLLQTVCFEEKWSNRTQTRLMRIARTITDLSGEEKISDVSIQEAVKWKKIASSIQDASNGGAERERNWHPNSYFHIIIRGNNRQNIFNGREDVNEYFRILNFVHCKFPYELYAYCIMTNHAHFLLKSPIVPLGKVKAPINRHYSDYYSKKHNYTGQIYENRYYSKEVINPIGLLNVGAYIHRNPIETKIPMVSVMEYYPYSSYQYYFHNHKSPHPFLDLQLLSSLLPVGRDKTAKEYARYCVEYKDIQPTVEISKSH